MRKHIGTKSTLMSSRKSQKDNELAVVNTAVDQLASIFVATIDDLKDKFISNQLATKTNNNDKTKRN